MFVVKKVLNLNLIFLQHAQNKFNLQTKSYAGIVSKRQQEG
ncbi:hypothetical protein D1BOALGB6SA_3134 [Olavius sp. associated proteobacterium Delta 1]|nr:hypothetical protein D1BOALGB6SA_3134 [Olavius sp. associated proteobacterium Delta 1]